MPSSTLQPSYAIAYTPTPLLNTPNFKFAFGGSSGTTIPLNASNLLKSVESVAFTGSKFKILDKLSDHVVRVATDEYPEQTVYVDRRFLNFVHKEPAARQRAMPTVPAVLETLESLLGTRYIWGGTWPSGIPSLLEYYPPQVDLSQVDPLITDTWQLKGVDCSGLLYYATGGDTPRNTSQLVSYGHPVPIEGKSLKQIVKQLQNLDLIVWKGHVVIVADSGQTIESLLGHGVIKQPLMQRLEEIMDETKRTPVDVYGARPEVADPFVVRRWHPGIKKAHSSLEE